MRCARWLWRLGGACGLALSACGTAPGNDLIVSIQDFEYTPGHLQGAPGQTVRVRNLDTAFHSMTSSPSSAVLTPGSVDGVLFDTGEFGAGERTFTLPPDAVPGTIVTFFCTVHHDYQHGTGKLVIE